VTGDSRPRLHVVPLTYRQACQLVQELHRHHRPPRGHKLSVGVADDSGRVAGVAMLGRPLSRVLDDGWTLEVTRTATDGTPNANSALYGAARRLALAMGYRRLVTYTQAGESGASLRGAGWRPVSHRGPRTGWTSPARTREDQGLDGVARVRWEAVLRPQREALVPGSSHGALTHSRSTHGSTHAPLPGNVTHEAPTPVTVTDVPAGQGQSRSRHAHPRRAAHTLPGVSIRDPGAEPHGVST